MFYLRLTTGRDNAYQPGRTLTLKEGDRIAGVAYHLPDDTLEEGLTLLWKWEMIIGCYLPTWYKLELNNGRTMSALVSIMDPRHPLFEPDTNTQVIAPLIARASGSLGTNAQYLFSLEWALNRLGMHDASPDDLVANVCTLLDESPTPGLA